MALKLLPINTWKLNRRCHDKT